MWLMVFFDLPVKTPEQRKSANKFRNFLKSDGYYMLQFSVYVRPARGVDACDKHLARAQSNLPKDGSVRSLIVTERQYANIKLLLGEQEKFEEVGVDQMVLL